jgi:uncharacterized protein (DUF1778 family)
MYVQTTQRQPAKESLPMTSAARRPDPKQPAAKKDMRDERIYFRATEAERALLQQAADVRGKSLTSFVLEAASREAERALLDQRFFQADNDQWERFKAALDRPPRDKPRLRALLAKPATVE